MKKVFVFVAVFAAAGAIGRTAPAETVAASLSDLFKPGAAFQDRNGDGGAIDFVDARIVLPDWPMPPSSPRRATSPRASGSRRRR